MSRTLSISIFRHNPRDPPAPRAWKPRARGGAGMTLFIALNRLRERRPDLSFDFVCRAGVRFLRDGDQRPAGSRLPHAHRRAARAHQPASIRCRVSR